MLVAAATDAGGGGGEKGAASSRTLAVHRARAPAQPWSPRADCCADATRGRTRRRHAATALCPGDPHTGGRLQPPPKLLWPTQLDAITLAPGRCTHTGQCRPARAVQHTSIVKHSSTRPSRALTGAPTVPSSGPAPAAQRLWRPSEAAGGHVTAVFYNDRMLMRMQRDFANAFPEAGDSLEYPGSPPRFGTMSWPPLGCCGDGRNSTSGTRNTATIAAILNEHRCSGGTRSAPTGLHCRFCLLPLLVVTKDAPRFLEICPPHSAHARPVR